MIVVSRFIWLDITIRSLITPAKVCQEIHGYEFSPLTEYKGARGERG